ncbi:MAG: KOW domain-containing RNA-binding protein [Lachnospiraceae bacterium]|nr:KOW domain-containing RNA-binding protein [Lachnospiraceae bacterium]
MENLIGRFAVSKAGHDEGTVYLIVGQEEQYLLLCDGEYKTLTNPKKKSLKHAQVVNTVTEAPMLSKLLNNEKIFDHEIKYAIKKYITNR